MLSPAEISRLIAGGQGKATTEFLLSELEHAAAAADVDEIVQATRCALHPESNASIETKARLFEVYDVLCREMWKRAHTGNSEAETVAEVMEMARPFLGLRAFDGEPGS